MSHIVRLVVGDWQRVRQGAWQFNYDRTYYSHDIVVKENETYASLLGMVRTKYHLHDLLPASDTVLLTYEFPDLTRDPTSFTSPPVEIKEDGDVELFMSVRIEYAWLELYVSFGERDVGDYRRQRNEDDGITLGVADRTEINIMEVEGILLNLPVK